jgi:acyl-CoA synthetase (NDP forming)
MPAAAASNLDPLFKPRTIAIYEAKDKLHYFINGLKDHSFDLDHLYLISPTLPELFGIPCYPSIADVPAEEIDLVILAVARERLLESVCAILQAKSVKFFHLYTAGTGELDDQGLQIEVELKDILAESCVRAIGPNCMGVYCPAGHTTIYPIFSTEPGHVGLIFQSGDLHTRFIIYGNLRHQFRFSKGVSVGNCLDLQVADFLAYLNEDEDTDFVCVYFEGFSRLHPGEGRHLQAVLAGMQKPVLFVRGGRTGRAQSAVQSHTGTLGTAGKMWDAVARQTGLIEAGGSIDDLLDCAYLFQHFFNQHRGASPEKLAVFLPKTKNALVALWSGGLGVLDTDILTEQGVHLPLFTGEVKEQLQQVYPLKVGSLANPLDLPWLADTDDFANIISAAAAGDVDVVIIETESAINFDADRHAKYYQNLLQIKARVVGECNKILLMILPEYPHPLRAEYYDQLVRDGFIVYSSIERAGKAFLALQAWGKKLTTS